MRKFVSLIFVLIFVFSSRYNVYSAPAYASYATIKSTCDATVIEVIDGDSLLVRINATGETALVRLIGIDCYGYTAAHEFAAAKLLGRTVFVVPDGSVKSPVQRWNYAYIFIGSSNFNVTMVGGGYAKVNHAHGSSMYFSDLREIEAKAKAKILGIWNVTSPSSPSYYAYLGAKVNINTASKEKLVEYLKISEALAGIIVSHRTTHPFKTIYDIKFVEGMTKEIFDDIRSRITISLNMYTASMEELQLLRGVTNSEASKIIDYRDRHGLINLSSLYDEKLISRSKYNENAPYIALKDVDKINYAEPDKIININTASYAQMEDIGFSDRNIRRVISYRETYTFKNMEDVRIALGLSNAEVVKYSDNITMFTDINNASLSELKSLFGESLNAVKNADILEKDRPFSMAYFVKDSLGAEVFDKIEGYIYFNDEDEDDYTTDYVNINNATVEQLKAVGFNSPQADKIYQNRGEMKVAGDIPYDLKKLGLDKKVTLFTNINKASASELKTLDTQLTETVAQSIISYRNDQPFGNLEEFRIFMMSQGKGYIYGSVKDAITMY